MQIKGGHANINLNNIIDPTVYIMIVSKVKFYYNDIGSL